MQGHRKRSRPGVASSTGGGAVGHFFERLLAWFSPRNWTDAWHQHPFRTLQSVYLARAFYVVAALDIPGLLKVRPRTCAELAQATGAHERSLCRVLRALTSFGIFAEDRGGVLRLTRRSRFLLSDTPNSLRDWILLVGSPIHTQALAPALEVVRSGNSGYTVAHGRTFWQYCEENPDFAATFGQAMSRWSDLHARVLIGAYDFGRFGTVLDVGGGEGRLLIEILTRHPGERGVLYERSETMPRAKARIAAAGLADRCELVAGNFLESVPSGAGAYILKHVLRDWDDADACKILSNCRQALGPEARLIVIDAMLDPRASRDRTCKLLDLEEMFLMGMLRTRDELLALLTASGLRVVGSRQTSLPDVAIIEAEAV
jgi:hypothetical protein